MKYSTEFIQIKTTLNRFFHVEVVEFLNVFHLKIATLNIYTVVIVQNSYFPSRPRSGRPLILI